DLDAIYSHSSYPAFTLNTLNTGSRQRPSGLLLFSYTFAGKLWFSLGYDGNGFEGDVIERWWMEFEALVREVLLA
ncbi:hypothetical protein T439DRAFT_290713, partial [Meredithblackwellia eburnea MCA 4105]